MVSFPPPSSRVECGGAVVYTLRKVFETVGTGEGTDLNDGGKDDEGCMECEADQGNTLWKGIGRCRRSR